ncbi:MAG: AAA family ATPase [Clostridia bacterium]|nr:AAA family ATPase [Clostridia bacterium]
MQDLRITRMEIISFGKLKNLVLEPGKGINVLTAPNESGKSTLAAFLKFVLYGFTDGRKKELAENDKKLYTPWDNSVAEGSVTLWAGEKLYRVVRSAGGTKESCTLTEVATGKTLPAGEVPGEYLFGVSEEVFSRTVFFKQLTAPQIKDGVLAEQLQNVAVSSEEQLSSKKAVDRLTKAKNELKGRAGNGKIPALERELAGLESALSDAWEERKELSALREEEEKQQKLLEANKKRTAETGEELENLRRYDAALKLKNLRNLQKEAEKAGEDYLEAKSLSGEVRAADVRVAAEALRGYDAAVKRLRAVEDVPFEEENEKEAPPPAGGHLLLVSGLLALAAGIGLCFVFLAVGIALAAVGLACLIRHFLSAGKSKAALDAYTQRTAAAEAKREALAKERELRIASAEAERQEAESRLKTALKTVGQTFGNCTAEDLSALECACYETEKCLTAFQTAKRGAEIAMEGVDLPALEELAKDAKIPARDRAAVERELRFLEEQSRMMGDRLSATRRSIAVIEGRGTDPGVLIGKRDAVKQQLEEARLRYTAYEAARAGIEEASDLMKSLVSPRVGEMAEAYFAAATGGKYRSLSVDTRLSMELRDENGVSRDCDYLSAGAKDSVYLSLRLALTELFFAGAGMPLILDDAFGRLDDERLTSMMKVLAAAGQKHQLFLFCCTAREEDTLKTLGVSYTKLEI